MKKNKKKGTTSKKAKQETAETPAADSAGKSAEASTAVDDKPAEDEHHDEGDAASPSAEPTPAQQSKLRSTSFRSGSIASGGGLSPVPFSPDGETAPDIYRKHVARIEDLEKENKRLSKEASESEKRWQKAEEELADLREADDDDDESKDQANDELAKLVSCSGHP